jgi:flagellar hook assembly protein FlgD
VINALLQNNPNPFNPATRITYSIAAAGPVELGVYDVRGRLVRTLVREKQNAGVYDVSWDGRGDAGGDLPSGIYLYTIKAGSFESVRKAVLMR